MPNAASHTPTSASLFHQAPMFRVALALAAGIFLSELLPPIPILVLCLVSVLAIGLMSFSTYLIPSRWLFLLAFWVAFASVGGLLVHLHAPADPFGACPTHQTHTLSVRLRDTPRQTSKCYKTVAEVDSLNGTPVRGRVMLFIAKDSLSANLQAGDRLHLTARPSLPSTQVGPDKFNYRRYLRRHGILWQCYVPSGNWQLSTNAETRNSLQLRFARIQQLWVQKLRRLSLTPQQQAVAEALLLGWRGDVDQSTQQQFRGAGIAHLLCVSGLHVGVMALLVGGCLFFLGRRLWQRIVKGIIQLLAVWFFVLLTGMAPSTLRAGVMFTLMIVGDMMEQRPNTLNNLATSAVLIFCFAPMQLFDVGFQLSYTAVLGILAWHRPLLQLLPSLAQSEPNPLQWLLGKVWSWTCLSTAAQLATLPLILYYFHQFPLYFLIANLTVVPFAGLLLATALLALAAGDAGWLTALLRLQLQAVDHITRWVSSLPSALLDNLYCDLPMLLFLFLALYLFTLWLRDKKPWALPATVASLLLLALYLLALRHHLFGLG